MSNTTRDAPGSQAVRSNAQQPRHAAETQHSTEDNGVPESERGKRHSGNTFETPRRESPNSTYSSDGVASTASVRAPSTSQPQYNSTSSEETNEKGDDDSLQPESDSPSDIIDVVSLLFSNGGPTSLLKVVSRAQGKDFEDETSRKEVEDFVARSPELQTLLQDISKVARDLDEPDVLEGVIAGAHNLIVARDERRSKEENGITGQNVIDAQTGLSKHKLYPYLLESTDVESVKSGEALGVNTADECAAAEQLRRDFVADFGGALPKAEPE
ncbi:hypothetical protein CLAFUW4_05602 [Fulvia fulva]|uniref:uncharacterized protein n=1 Tax=Passalora fulva TaxID=5499 RepID=UPI0028524CD6|nr:uncharacterized protein CLAFUR5_20206 [Fulvia fulva]KAK4624678.1 hypothetical protein CLAFUR4_05597 [Fulvia fulva]KAK4625682.1 hypothetical protein CLAFUR0_05605 [Fulvia fulva]WMI38898.1 hypothetical protein CLAFUR5_20206 [Fulvia fulva]WPV15132.1 hypothetical protein CLAFUW4_05602 [Fulvia fulva]WPV29729.1 hypothetical protein CLAFUW7_05601 [Fulvia fulva]